MRLFPNLRYRWTEYRRLSKPYHKEVRGWVHSKIREAFTRNNVLISSFLAITGPLIFWWWEAARNMTVDPAGLLIAAAAPVALYLVGLWVWYRFHAPIYVWARYKQFYDGHNPPLPWATSVLLHHDGSGATFRLLTRGNPERADKVSCEFHLKDHVSPAKRKWEAVEISQEHPLELVYPADFQNADWPLGRGEYEATWHIDTAAQRATYGAQLRIKR